ncbi:MAG: TonB-dependent receptor [Pseudomonadales bacterium]
MKVPMPSNKRTIPLPRPLPFARSPLALAIAAAAGLASIQPAPARADDGDATIETIQVIGTRESSGLSSSKFLRPLLDTAQTVDVVPEQIIEERAATTLRDVLKNVSGISMQAGEGGTPAGDQLSIRGYSARTDIFVDGVRDFGGYTRDPFAVQQVEVVKGPSSDYTGRGGTGGSINLVSKAPSLENDLSASLMLGTDEFTRVTVDGNRAFDGLGGTALRLNMMVHDQEVAGRDEVANGRWGVAPSLAFGLESDTQVSVGLFYLEQDNVPDYGIPWVPADNVPLAAWADDVPPVDFGNWYGLTTRDFEDVSTAMATVRFEHRLSETASIDNITRYGVTDRDSMITAPRFAGTDSTDIRRSDEKYRDDVNEILSNQTNLVVDLDGRVNQRLLLGMEFIDERETRNTRLPAGSDSPATDLYTPTPDDPYLENYQPTGTASRSEARTFAIYAGDSIALGERWIVNGGLRWDRFELDYTPDGQPRMERDDDMLSYRLGLIYKPVPAGSIYLGYGTSFNPTAEGLAISTSARQPGIGALDPEENRAFELGTKWEIFDRRLLLTGAVFHMEKTNARTQDPNDPDDVLVLEGEQRVRGLELGIAGEVLPRVNVYAGYTFLDTEILESKDPAEVGKELGNAPRNTFSWWSTWDVTGRLQLGAGAQFVDDRYNSLTNTRTAPAYWTFEASASYRLSEILSLRLNVQNLTDEEYIDYVGGGHFIPGAGRMVLLSSTIDL